VNDSQKKQSKAKFKKINRK